MQEPLPADLEARIRAYEDPANDPGPFSRADWRVVLLAGVLLPAVCIVLGWFVGWPS